MTELSLEVGQKLYSFPWLTTVSSFTQMELGRWYCTKLGKFGMSSTGRALILVRSSLLQKNVEPKGWVLVEYRKVGDTVTFLQKNFSTQESKALELLWTAVQMMVVEDKLLWTTLGRTQKRGK